MSSKPLPESAPYSTNGGMHQPRRRTTAGAAIRRGSHASVAISGRSVAQASTRPITPATIQTSARLKTYHSKPPTWNRKKSATAPWTQPVDDVGERAADDEAERERRRAARASSTATSRRGPRRRCRGRSSSQRPRVAVLRQEPVADAAVPDHDEIEERRQRHAALAARCRTGRASRPCAPGRSTNAESGRRQAETRARGRAIYSAASLRGVDIRAAPPRRAASRRDSPDRSRPPAEYFHERAHFRPAARARRRPRRPARRRAGTRLPAPAPAAEHRSPTVIAISAMSIAFERREQLRIGDEEHGAWPRATSRSPFATRTSSSAPSDDAAERADLLPLRLQRLVAPCRRDRPGRAPDAPSRRAVALAPTPPRR